MFSTPGANKGFNSGGASVTPTGGFSFNTPAATSANPTSIPGTGSPLSFGTIPASMTASVPGAPSSGFSLGGAHPMSKPPGTSGGFGFGATSAAPSLFGGATSTPASTGTSLFGAPALTASSAAQAGSAFKGAPTNLFGTSMAASTAGAAPTSMFSSTPGSVLGKPATASAPSAFSTTRGGTMTSAAMASSAASALLGSSLYGLSSTVAPGTGVAPTMVPSGLDIHRTKLEDLPKEIQEAIARIDQLSQTAKLKGEALREDKRVEEGSRRVGEAIRGIQERLPALEAQETRGVEEAHRISQGMQRLHHQTDMSLRAFEAHWRRVEEREGGANVEGQAGKPARVVEEEAEEERRLYQRWILRYLEEVVTHGENVCTEYTQSLEALGRSLGLGSGGAGSPVEGRMLSERSVGDIVRNQQRSFLALAGKVAALHRRVEELKQRYREWRSSVHGDRREVFREGRRSARPSWYTSGVDEGMGRDGEGQGRETRVNFAEIARETIQPRPMAAMMTPAAPTPSTVPVGGFGPTFSSFNQPNTFSTGGSLFGR